VKTTDVGSLLNLEQRLLKKVTYVVYGTLCHLLVRLSRQHSPYFTFLTVQTGGRNYNPF
jgi:hypothetical protein